MSYLKNINGIFKKSFSNILVWLVLIVIWQILAILKIINLNFIATPSGILSAFSQVNFWKIFIYDFTYSINRIIIGFVLAFLTSYLLIFLAIFIPRGLFVLSRIQALVKYIPAPVLIPISILIFGISDQTKIAVVFFTALVLQVDYLLGVIKKDEQKYAILQKSWKIRPVERFKNFIFPISIYLYYRVLPSLVMWVFSISIISEIILGGEAGLGVRIIQFQQIYNTNYLYAYLILILFLAFFSEFVLVNFFSRFQWDKVKIVSAVALIVSLLCSVVFSLSNFTVISRSNSLQNSNSGLTILTYKATANLPLLVYKERFNNEFPVNIEYVSSGLQVMDALLSDKVYAGGFSDMPNVISGISKKRDLKIISQVVEKPEHPNLFFISNSGNLGDLSSLNNKKIGYFPNNLIIKQGLDFVLFTKGVRTSSVEYVSSNDPNSLVQAYTSGNIQALLTIEPYAADLEKNSGDNRLNSRDTFVKGANFDRLPLAGLVVNTKYLSATDLDKFNTGLIKSLEFIRQNTGSDLKATGELREIMLKNQLNPDSQVSAYETGVEIDPENLRTLINYAQMYQVDGLENLEKLDVSSLYKLE